MVATESGTMSRAIRSGVVIATGLALFFFHHGRQSTGFQPQPYGCYPKSACHGHDPTGLQKVTDKHGTYYVTLVTGSGDGEALGIRYIKKGWNYWQKGPNSYMMPDWILKMFPTKKMNCGPGTNKTACALWAPDLPSNGNGLYMTDANEMLIYYSIADWADNDKGIDCIGYARAGWPSLHLEDSGTPVICQNSSEANRGAPHSIDPSVMVDADGDWWLTYGSWSNYGKGAHQGARGGGVWMVPLDSETGGLREDVREKCGKKHPFCFDLGAYKNKTSFFLNIANHRGYHSPEGYVDGNSIEASYLYNNVKRTGYYYLFVNWFFCCRAEDSTYQIMVGRSKNPSGPFYDKDGVNMKDDGGSLFLNTTTTFWHKFTGPGHAGILYEEEEETYVYTTSWEAIDTSDMQLDAFELGFDDDDWPVLKGQFNLWRDSDKVKNSPKGGGGISRSCLGGGKESKVRNRVAVAKRVVW